MKKTFFFYRSGGPFKNNHRIAIILLSEASNKKKIFFFNKFLLKTTAEAQEYPSLENYAKLEAIRTKQKKNKNYFSFKDKNTVRRQSILAKLTLHPPSLASVNKRS